MAELERIGDFFVCQNEKSSPVSLRRVSEEVVCLGFDPAKSELVELHIISDSEQMKGNGKLSFLERAWTAATLKSPCFPNILKAADDGDLYFYATGVNEGEFLTDYIVRNGPVSPNTALAMGLDLADSLLEVEPHYRLLLGLRLTNLMVVLDNSAYLTLRIIDLGLGRPEPRSMNDFEMSSVLADLSRQIYYLLSGKPYAVGQMAHIDQISGIDASVCELLKQTIEPDSASIDSFEKYQELLEKGYEATSNKTPRRSAIGASPKTRPRLTLQREIFDRANYKAQLETEGYSFDAKTGDFEYPYSTTTSRKGTEDKGRLSWIPPENVTPVGKIESSLTVKDGFRFRFIPNLNGLSLHEFLVNRNHRPSVVDTILLLNGLCETLNQNPQPFSPHQVWLGLPGKSNEDIDAISKKGLDSWPAVSVTILPPLDTSVFLNPTQSNKDLKKEQQVVLSFVNTARELLHEAPGEIHEFLDQVEPLVKNGENYLNTGELLVELADRLDDAL